MTQNSWKLYQIDNDWFTIQNPEGFYDDRGYRSIKNVYSDLLNNTMDFKQKYTGPTVHTNREIIVDFIYEFKDLEDLTENIHRVPELVPERFI